MFTHLTDDFLFIHVWSLIAQDLKLILAFGRVGKIFPIKLQVRSLNCQHQLGGPTELKAYGADEKKYRRASTEAAWLSEKKSVELTETLLEIIKSTLESGEDVLVSGFGKFCVQHKRERKGRNPATGRDMVLPARRIVTFKWSGRLRDKLNGK